MKSSPRPTLKLPPMLIALAILVGGTARTNLCYSKDGIIQNVIKPLANLSWEAGVSPIRAIRNSVTIKECLGRLKTVELRDCDEIWLIDARNSHNSPCDLSRLRVKKLSGPCWHPATMSELTSAHLVDQSKETVVYIHGHQTDRRWSITRGMQVYESLFLGCQARKPVRLVIWQWKSEREMPRMLPDFRDKSKRAYRLGKTLALTLDQFHNRDMTLIGFSLGCQTVLAALGEPEMGRPVAGFGYRVALIGPVLDCGFASSCAVGIGNPVDQTIVFYNRFDRAIKLAEKICRKRQRRNYVSTRQVISSQLIPLGHLRCLDIGSETGKKHLIVRYVASPTLQNSILNLVSRGCETCFIASDKQSNGFSDVADARLPIDDESIVKEPLPNDYLISDPVWLPESAPESAEYFRPHDRQSLFVETPKALRSSRRSAAF